MTTDPPLGSRVVLRYRLPAGSPQPMTDVIGELVSADPVAVRTQQGRVVSVLGERIVALKALGPRPIRTSEIRALEYAAADGWPGTEQEWIDGWLLRAGAGFTGRANSAAPLADTATEASLDRVQQWFLDRDLPPRLLLPDRLGTVPDGWHSWDEVVVMAADIAAGLVLPSGPSMVLVDDHPSQHWLESFRYRGAVPPPQARAVIESVRNGELGFGRIGGGARGETLAIARAAVTTAPDGLRWVGLTAVEVVEQHRRHGLGTLICAEMIRWGRDRGATHAYLQVAESNSAAVAMYRELGFVEHHRYRYAAPA